MRYRYTGWRQESARHSLAARGIRTRFFAVKKYSFPFGEVTIFDGPEAKAQRARDAMIQAEKDRQKAVEKVQKEMHKRVLREEEKKAKELAEEKLEEEIAVENEELQREVEEEGYQEQARKPRLEEYA